MKKKATPRWWPGLCAFCATTSLASAAPVEPQKLSLMWVGAHPDDEHWGAAALFSKVVLEQGDRGVYVVATRGEAYAKALLQAYALGQQREQETRNSAAGVDVHHLRFAGIWDGQVNTGSNPALLRERLVRIIREVQPDIIITHGSNGEYGHSDHKALSAQCTQAYSEAADPTRYPEQLAQGLGVWQAKKLYHTVEYSNTAPVTFEIPSSEYSRYLGANYGPWADNLVRTSHSVSVHADFKRCRLSLIDSRVGPIANETDVRNGLNRGLNRTSYIQNWLICGPHTTNAGALNIDHLSDSGGEADIIPEAGMVSAGRPWTRLINQKDYVNFREMYAPNYDAVAYAYSVIRSESAQAVAFSISSHDGVKAWLNGKLVHSSAAAREYDYGDHLSLPLVQGDNRLLIKVRAGGRHVNTDTSLVPRPWGFFAGIKGSVTKVTPSSDGNLALGRPVTVSSIEGHKSLGLRAVDDDPNSRWSSQSDDPQFIYVDLEGTYVINRVVLKWASSYATNYQIQVSDDALTWTDIHRVTHGDGGPDDLAVAGSGRYVRMYGTQAANQVGYSLYDFAIYGTSGTTPPVNGGDATQPVARDSGARDTPLEATRPLGTDASGGTAGDVSRAAPAAEAPDMGAADHRPGSDKPRNRNAGCTCSFERDPALARYPWFFVLPAIALAFNGRRRTPS